MGTHLRDGWNKTVTMVLCRLDEIADGESRGFLHAAEDDDIEFFVVRRGEVVFGYFNDCPHIGTPLNWKNKNFLTLDKSMIVCATHGAVFRIEDGNCSAGPCVGQRLKPIDVTCKNGNILLHSLGNITF